jgi:hypothetical protein
MSAQDLERGLVEFGRRLYSSEAKSARTARFRRQFKQGVARRREERTENVG